jgi:serine/threonine protein kinase/Tol biopolymer transport system component
MTEDGSGQHGSLAWNDVMFRAAPVSADNGGSPMPLAPGQRLGPYEVVSTLGAGGMGEVYRARDTALNRDVAIKVLPDAFAKDPDRLTRFTREARALAALNHPNIAHIHGLDETGGVRALVMELVDGEDLSDRIARGSASAAPQPRRTGLPLAEVLPIARQIAEALEAAHEQGIVHRDLKPANIKVRPDGTVKVLDFGLAKAMEPGAMSASANVMDSPTFTSPAGMTEMGVILGTAAYMAPEQARGKAVDKRADIWAFGVVLYEMLTGTRAFAGEGSPDVLAAVLRQEIQWNRLPAGTPARVRQLLERCLTADVKQRLRDIGEARVALAAIERDPQEPVRDTGGSAVAIRAAWRERFAWGVAALALVTAGALVALTRFAGNPPSSDHAVRLSMLPPPGLVNNPDSANLAISPDGRMVAFVVGAGISVENQLWVRAFDSPVARRIESGDGVSLPFWSPDSTRIGFFAGRKLKTVAASGGAAIVLCDAAFGRGGTWSRSNVIVFAPDAQGPLLRVSANGGAPVPASVLDASRKEMGHRFPAFLPDGDRFLFATIPGSDSGFDVVAGSVRDLAARTRIGSMETVPVYAEPGWLVFARQGVLTAQRFDAKALRLTGEAVSLGDQPGVAPGQAAYEAGPRVSASTKGSLAYYLPPVVDTRVQWMDFDGRMTAIVAVPAGRYVNLAIAPDNTKAVLVREDGAAESSLWLTDLTRAGNVPLSTGGGRNGLPVWSPDSKRVMFSSDRGGLPRAFYEKTVEDASAERRVMEFDDRSAEPRGWSNDDAIFFTRVDPVTRWNIYRVAASGGSAPVPVIVGPAIEVGGRLSPNGRWLGYLSDETGRLDMFVQPASLPGPKLQLSTGGVELAWWMPDGRQLLHLKRDKTLWSVTVDLDASPPRIDAPKQVGAFPANLVAMDLAPDGRRFLALVPERTGIGAITIVQSWQAALAASR